MTRKIEIDKLEGVPVRIRCSKIVELRRLSGVFKTNVSTIIRRAVDTEIVRLQDKEQS